MSHSGPIRQLFEIVPIDIIGGFGGSRSTKKYRHLLFDHFTRYTYTYFDVKDLPTYLSTFLMKRQMNQLPILN